MRVVNLSTDKVIAEVEIAKTWVSRLRGLLFRKSLPAGGGLILKPCNSIHTCFMQFDIDVLFVDHYGVVVYMIKSMSPFRFSPIIRNAGFIVELPAGTIEASGISLNDRVVTQPEIIQ